MTLELPPETFDGLRAERRYSVGEGLAWDSLDQIVRAISPPLANPSVVHPLTRDIIVYCPERAKRPHHVPSANGNGQQSPSPVHCPICVGDTTPILDSVPLVPTDRNIDGTLFVAGEKQRYAFVNINRYAALSPHNGQDHPEGRGYIRGAHLLNWPSTEHCDIDALSSEEHAQCFVLMQHLEELVDNVHATSLQVIKNTGAAAGSSLDHGHYQVILSSVEPRHLRDLRSFSRQRGFSFAGFSARSISEEHVVKDYDAVTLLTPPWIRKPLEVMVIPKDLAKERISELSPEELRSFAAATGDVARVLKRLMPAMGKEYAWNMMIYSGKGIGTLYADIIPCTQITGGFEHSGLWICQSSPILSTQIYREWFEKLRL